MRYSFSRLIRFLGKRKIALKEIIPLKTIVSWSHFKFISFLTKADLTLPLTTLRLPSKTGNTQGSRGNAR